MFFKGNNLLNHLIDTLPDNNFLSRREGNNGIGSFLDEFNEL